MITSQALCATVLGLLLSTSAPAQTAAHYRDFQLGADLASISVLTGVAASEAKTIHARPALLQELQWLRPFAVSGETGTDPVQQIAFSFYNDQLFRLVIDYERDRTEGLTDGDMIDAISAMYGTAGRPAARSIGAPASVIDAESGTRVAKWGDAEYSAVLYRTSYASGFRMVVTSVRLNALARTAEAQALRLEDRDAPARERAREKAEADEARASKEKARLANKGTFKP